LEELLQLTWHVPSVMVVLLIAGLMMGQRHVGELSVFDLLTGIAIGAVAGAGIVDLDLPLVPVLASIIGLAVLHFAMTWVMKKWAWFGRITTFEPIVVVKHGQPLRSAMKQVRLSLSDLLPLLREKDVFDLREVEYAVLEPDGKLTVLKVQTPPTKHGLTRAVCLDGKIEVSVLHDLGWDEERLRSELQQRGLPAPEAIFVATMDEGGTLHVVPKGSEVQSHGPALQH